jgi:2-methylisocitrate lyase-like PEP mutase family enzyme
MTALARPFLALYQPGTPLIIPNPWDIGSARALATAGFAALATNISGFAATLGRRDMQITRDEALAHAAQLVAAVDVPVSADLENGFGREPEAVIETVTGAVAAGLAGCSIEDNDPAGENQVYDIGLATERIAAAVQAAAGELVLTARAENFIRGRQDLADTIARLQRYAEAGADVLYAPGLTSADDIRAVVQETGKPVNVLLMPGTPDVAGLATLGVARISVGGSFAWVTYGALARAAQELLTGSGPYGFWDLAKDGRELTGRAFPAAGTEG